MSGEVNSVDEEKVFEVKAQEGPLLLLDFDGTLLDGDLKTVIKEILKFFVTGSEEENAINRFLDKLIDEEYLPEQSRVKLKQLLQDYFHSQKLYTSFSREEILDFQCRVAALFSPTQYVPAAGSEEKCTVIEVINHALDDGGIVMILTLNPYVHTIRPVLINWGLMPTRAEQIYILCLSCGVKQHSRTSKVIFVPLGSEEDEILDKNILIKEAIWMSKIICQRDIRKKCILYADDNNQFRNAAKRKDLTIVIDGNYKRGEHLLQIKKKLIALKNSNQQHFVEVDPVSSSSSQGQIIQRLSRHPAPEPQTSTHFIDIQSVPFNSSRQSLNEGEAFSLESVSEETATLLSRRCAPSNVVLEIASSERPEKTRVKSSVSTFKCCLIL